MTTFLIIILAFILGFLIGWSMAHLSAKKECDEKVEESKKMATVISLENDDILDIIEI